MIATFRWPTPPKSPTMLTVDWPLRPVAVLLVTKIGGEAMTVSVTVTPPRRLTDNLHA